MSISRKEFVKRAGLASTGFALSGLGLSAGSYGRIMGANDRINVGIVGFSARTRAGLLPDFFEHAGDLNFTVTAVSDIWNRRRSEAKAFFDEQNINVALCRNNEELYERNDVDAVIIGTVDFQHALHTIEAVEAGKDAYVEKPFAEAMEDNVKARDAVENSDRIIQMGTQRRSDPAIKGMVNFVQSGEFGEVVMVELRNNRNNPDRWKRPQLVKAINESDTDWRRYLMNRPYEPWDPRKYIEYRWFWPYSSGIIGQWMAHHIDQVQWITGYDYPRSVVANGGHFLGHELERNPNTLTVVLDYGPKGDLSKGFQVIYSSRFTNSAGRNSRVIYSNRGSLNMQNNRYSSDGAVVSVDPLNEDVVPEASSYVTEVGNDTNNHVRNWMECVRSRKEPTAPVKAGYSHSLANIMANTALRSGKKVTYDAQSRNIMAGGEILNDY